MFTALKDLFETFRIAFALTTSILPFLLPFFLIPVIWSQYITWKRLNFALEKTKDAILFEIIVPANMERPVAAMELVLNLLYQTGSGTPSEAVLDGVVRPWFSLEIASNGGQVHYYVWAWSKYKELIEQAFYAQFPQVEVKIAPDYMQGVFHDPEARIVWGTGFKLFAPDAYPIKTYIDYELHKNPDEEVKTDPLTPIIELLGSMKQGERMWYQILVRGHDPQDWKAGNFTTWHFFDQNARKEKKWRISPGTYSPDSQDWKKRISAEIKEIKENSSRKMLDVLGNEVASGLITYEPGQDDLIKDMRRHQDKFPFEIAIRSIYIAEKDAFNPNNIPAMRMMLAGFKKKNGIKPDGATHTDVSDEVKDYGRFFSIFRNIIIKRKWKKEEKLLNAFRYRSRFYPPFHSNVDFTETFVVSVEALATLFHPLGSVSGTPSLERVESKKSQPPVNLPM